MGKKSGLPDRWPKYSNMGRAIPGTSFISFKVPLSEKFEVHGSDFSLRDLTDHCPQLGLVIDLTNTTKYYDPQALKDQNIQYKKIFTIGHVLPSNSVVRQFIDAANEFFEKSENNGKLVGVHCTHGVNRTGYLICRYMIQVLDIAPDQAISDFNSARGHALERSLYTKDLCSALWIDEDPATYKLKKVTVGANQTGGHQHGKKQKKKNNNRRSWNSSYNEYRRNSDNGGNDQQQSDDYYDEDVNNYYGNESEGSTPQTPNTPGGGGPFNRSRDRLQSDSTPRSWRVLSRDRSSFDGHGSPDTPRGVKRHLDVTESRPSTRGPWLPPCEGGYFNGGSQDWSDEPPRLKFKRNHIDPRYGKNQSYDPYFYQQRMGGGPTRGTASLDPKPTTSYEGRGRTAGTPRQYKGPKRYCSPQRQLSNENGDGNDEGLLVLKGHEPLVFPNDLSPLKGILGSPPVDGPSRDPKSPCTQPDVFSPEPTPGGSSKRRTSKRYEPY